WQPALFGRRLGAEQRLRLAAQQPAFHLGPPRRRLAGRGVLAVGLVQLTGRLVEPLLGLVGVAQAVVGHRQQQPIQDAAALAGRRPPLIEPADRVLVSAGPVQGAAERVQVGPVAGRVAERLFHPLHQRFVVVYTLGADDTAPDQVVGLFVSYPFEEPLAQD